MITAEEVIWHPELDSLYNGRQDVIYLQIAMYMNFDKLIELVQARAKEDGEWAIENNLVGDNEDRMRRMMEWVSDETHIRQCVEHLHKNGRDDTATVDWVCRELANASKMSVGGGTQ